MRLGLRLPAHAVQGEREAELGFGRTRVQHDRLFVLPDGVARPARPGESATVAAVGGG